MGWFGYGKYDGDGTATVQMSMVEAVGYKDEILLKDGQKIEISNWNVGSESLADEVVKKVFSRWDKVEKKAIKSTNEEYNAINYMMAADFFINHKAYLPEGLKEKAIESVQYLMKDHAADFDVPSKRRSVLKNFLNKLEDYPELSIFTKATKNKIK